MSLFQQYIFFTITTHHFIIHKLQIRLNALILTALEVQIVIYIYWFNQMPKWHFRLNEEKTNKIFCKCYIPNDESDNLFVCDYPIYKWVCTHMALIFVFWAPICVGMSHALYKWFSHAHPIFPKWTSHNFSTGNKIPEPILILFICQFSFAQQTSKEFLCPNLCSHNWRFSLIIK